MPDIEVTDLRLDTDSKTRDNFIAIQNTLRLIQEALDNIEQRLEALE